MLKRLMSAILAVSVSLAAIPAGVVFAESEQITEISNQYIKVLVNNKNGGYVISTLEGDILKKSDNNAFLTHRGENYDTSFTSFKIGNDEYVFGEKYGLFGQSSSDVVTERDVNGDFIKSTWSVDGFEICQNISLVNNDSSEQLGTAMITYTVKNNSQSVKDVKSRILIDTQLGDNDYGYYEVPKQNLGQGYEYFEFERTWDSSLDSTIRMPSDYFVRDNPYSSSIVGYGVNSVFTEQKPYKMTFAHWANIAATVFDYEPDKTLNFTNNLNDKKTADSAAALYYSLGTIAAGSEKSFSTYYGVTANLKNKENKIILNTTAPSKLDFTDESRTAYKGSEGDDNIVRINVNLTNPALAGKNYKKLAVVAYALGFDTQRQTDSSNWIQYDNADPIYTDIVNFQSGDNKVTYFDFKFTPKNRAQLGTFVIKVFDMDPSVNELGYYAEEYCLATSENHIILPGKDKTLPAVTLTGLSPNTIYNQDIRYITVTGKGAEFFKSELLDKIYLIGENGMNYEIPIDNLTFEQGDNPSSVTLMLDEYMEPGRYNLHFIWKTGTNESALDGVPSDFTSDAMVVQVSSDKKYSNASYGIVTVQRTENKGKYTVVPYKNEDALKKADIDDNDLLLSFRGEILQDKSNKNLYRLIGKDKDININYILNYHGDDFTVEEKSNGTVEVLMDGKITTVGANTTVRNGSAAFRLNSGTEYIIPEYDANGEVQDNGTISAGQDFIELKWDNAFDILTTVGGFLVDLKYGVLGKIKNSDKTTSDIISFGGSLDLGFMTPGGAAAARQNTAAGARWTTDLVETEHDDLDDGYTFGLTFDEDSGTFKSQTVEKDIPPANKEANRVEAGASIHDILYGGKNPGYLGINMDAHISLPQIVKFLPNQIEGELSINTIGGYKVGVDADVETGNLSMALSLVVKSSPSKAPIPDKLYFTIGGFEPGLNVDNLGIVWITGGGGGIDNLYDTIYGSDGVPPLTVLLHVDFDITKIMTGNADLELSLRSLKISIDKLSLKMVENADFVKGGEIAVGWYPNFSLNLSGGVNFLQIMTGSITITAAAGKDTADFVQFVLNVSIGLPKYIPIVGGMELASAELGGGSEKVWGSVELLSLIKVGFTYYWGGDIEFTHGNTSDTTSFAALSANDDDGVKRTKVLFNQMLEPVRVGTDPETGKAQFASIGGNLSYSAGSRMVSDFEEIVSQSKTENQSGIRLMSLPNAQTEIFTNSERSSHLVKFGDSCDYILSVSRADGSEIDAEALKKCMSVTKNGTQYELNYYKAPSHSASDEEKKNTLKNANVNISQNAAYIAIPNVSASDSMLIEFSDNNAYDISAVKVNPTGTLTSCNTAVNGNVLHIEWNGENISDSARIIVRAADGSDENGIVLNDKEIPATSKSADIEIPDKLASGEYSIKVTLSDENTVYETYDAGKVKITDKNAPNVPENVSIENCGNNKLKIVVENDESNDFDGYLVEVYENGKLADTGLYFEKGEDIIVGGRYEMPVSDSNGNSTVKTVGYTPGKEYSARVRLCNVVKDTDGNDVYHSSAYKATNTAVTLKEASQPTVHIEYDKNMSAIKVNSDVPICGELYINSSVKDGEWYEFSEKKTELLQNVSLPDGDYTVEFHAVDADGDRAIASEIISIDTTAPVIMLASPINGSCFSGDSIVITATADKKDVDYTFKINGETVTPYESDIFSIGMMKCTLPLGKEKDSASIRLEITARDSAGNETVKYLDLTNENISKINSILVTDSDQQPVPNGILSLGNEKNTAIKVIGKTTNNETIDITDLNATAIEVIGGSSAVLDGADIKSVSVGQTMVRASFALGGNELLYDGIVVNVTDSEALEAAIMQAEQITNTGYTDKSWSDLENAISKAKEVMNSNEVTQSEIDNASALLENAVAGLRTKSSGSGSGSSGGGAVYCTVTFDSNGGSTVSSLRLQFGSKAEKPENPVKDGFTFGGWYSDKELTVPYSFSESISQSFTLYAKWIENGTEQTEWKNPFTDVKESDWFYENVKYSVLNKLFCGMTESTFEPNIPITRGMVVTVLYRAEGEPDADGAAPFDDVAADSYYNNAVIWAKENNIVNGMSETAFAPDDNITREQLAAIIHRYAGYKGYDISTGENTNLLSYNDAESISEYAVSAMQYTVGSGLIKGRSESTLNPKDNTTRAEAAAILHRFSEMNK